MFKKILILLVLALTSQLVAQNAPPNGFLYQAVVRDANGNLAANRTIYVQIAIKKTTATGTTVYADNYVVQSNADAMFSIVIGQGTNKSGTYSNLLSIPWGSDKFFFNLKLCVAPSLPGTGFTPSYRDMGTTQLWSVPYAMFANKAQSSMDSLTVTSSGNTRKLKLGNYTPIYFNVADQDSSKTNEIQTISRNGGRLFLNLNGGVISLPDSSALNELQTISRTGGRITLNQGGGTISLPDSSATNELQTISKTASTITLSNGGGSVIDSDNQNLAITAGKGTIQIAGGNNIKLADSSAVNELQNLTLSSSGSNRNIGISNGNNIVVNVNDADSSVSNELQTISQSPNKGTVVLSKNGGSIVLPDSSATNEIQNLTQTLGKGTVVLSKNGGSIVLPDSSASNELQTISKTGSTITLSNGGGSVIDSDNQNLAITAGKGTIQIAGGNNIKLADSSATNELQNLSLSSSGSNRNIGISNGNNIVVNVNDADSSVTNELQTLSKTGNTVTLSNGGGSITVTDNQTLSSAGSGSNKTISISGGNSINLTVGDADSSVSNEIQSLAQSTNKGTVVLSKNGGSIVLPDSSATNELQTISRNGGRITLNQNGGSVNLPDSSSTNEIQTLSISNDTLRISGGNSVKLPNSGNSNSQTPSGTYRIGFASSGNWICPQGVTSITVELWGGAGGGGGSGTSVTQNGGAAGCLGGGCARSGAAGNGGNGGYNKATLSVTPGVTYFIKVGQGGSAGVGGVMWSNWSGTAGGDGDSSMFGNLLKAAPGKGGGAGISIFSNTGNYSCSNGSNGQSGAIVNYSVVKYPIQGVTQPRSFIPVGYVNDFVNSNSYSAGGSGGYAVMNCYNYGNPTNGINGNPGESGYCVIIY